MHRIAPTPRFNKHSGVIRWFNDLMFDLKTFAQDGKQPVITPRRYLLWMSYRDDLYCTDVDRFIKTGKEVKLHQPAIDVINALIDDLERIYNGDNPARSFDEARIAELDALYNNLKQCKEDGIKY